MRALAAAALSAAVLVVACATSAPAPSGGDPLAAGERAYREHCGACHRLRSPSEQTREGWARAVDKYGPRAHLGDAERPLVLAYLQAHAKDAAPATESK